ncbi:arylsulfatase [candidate division KSB1 bacterium]|nr:arylsulfatase [candidate division KSB1 bacterium]
MNRRQFMLNITAANVAFSLPTLLMAEKGRSRSPNIILIMADDLGWKELGCYGQEKIKTPHINRLALEGMRFTQYYAGSAVCAPSRCNLMTGKHGGHAFIRANVEIENPAKGIFGGQAPLQKDTPGIAKTLKTHGYTTGCFGKWGLGAVGSSGDPLEQGFDRFYGYNCQRHAHNLYPNYLVSDKKNVKLEGNTRGITGQTYAPQRIADEMLTFVRKNKNNPFFVYYPTVLPHLALQAPEEDIAAYRGKWDEKPYDGEGEVSYLPHPTPKSCYAAMITFMDRQVGRLMELLKELEIDDNTVVLFISDNGTTFLKRQVDYSFFESVGPLRGLKGSLYEGGIRVPLVVRWPGRIPAGTISDHLSAHYDMPATLAELAGTSFEQKTDGISMLPVLLGRQDEQKKHDFLIWDFAGYGGQIAVRMGKWKGIKKGLNENLNAPLELYNLEEDIGENNNVVKEHPDIANKIENIMLRERTTPAIKTFRFGKYQDNDDQKNSPDKK